MSKKLLTFHIIYNFEVDGMKNRVNYSEISPGEFSLGQSTGGLHIM